MIKPLTPNAHRLTPSVKICGLKTKPDIQTAIDNGADFLGFIFFPPSPRNISPQQAQEISANVPTNIKKVAVIVDMSEDDIYSLLSQFDADIIQMHGEESPEFVQNIKDRFKLPIIKAIPVEDKNNLEEIEKYKDIADYIMLDKKPDITDGIPGGTGKSFNWDILKNTDLPNNWILSGGLNIDNVTQAIEQTGASFIDVSSGVEKARGVKDPELIKAFLQKAKH